MQVTCQIKFLGFLQKSWADKTASFSLSCLLHSAAASVHDFSIFFLSAKSSPCFLGPGLSAPTFWFQRRVTFSLTLSRHQASP